MSANESISAVSARAERSAMKKWAAAIVGLLLLQVIFGGVTMALAMHGRGVVVEQDYYNKALHWDDHEAMVQASAKLGWTTDISVGGTATSQGQRALILKLADKSGVPIDNARVEVAFFHHAHPLDIKQSQLKATAAGTYAGSVPLDQPGIWEFRLTIHRPVVGAGVETRPGGAATSAPDEVFIATLQRDLLE